MVITGNGSKVTTTPVGQKRKLEDAESDPLKQLQLLDRVTRLGTRWLAIQKRDPEAFGLMLSQLEELEKGKPKEAEGNPIQDSTQEQSQIYAAQSAVKCNSAAEADSGGASKAAAAQTSQNRPPVWSRLGRAGCPNFWSTCSSSEAGGGGASMQSGA